MSYKGDLEKVKQVFQCVIHENISVEEMGVQNNNLDKEKKPKFVDGTYVFNGRHSRLIASNITVYLNNFYYSFMMTDLDFLPKNESILFYSPLISAARGGHAHVCEYLIKEQYANLEPMPTTPLIVAAMHNHTEVIKVLLQIKANIRAYDLDGGHAAYYAASAGHLGALKMLVEEDINVINLRGVEGEPPLLAAVDGRHVDVCKYMVEEKNADVNAKCFAGDTALDRAYDPEIIEILRNTGARYNWTWTKNKWKHQKIPRKCKDF